MMKSNTVYLIFVLSLSLTSWRHQPAPAPPPEQLYLHHDKPFYLAGEDIWYKVYFLNEDTAQLASRVIHVQLQNPDGQLLSEHKLRRTGRSAYGKFSLPADQEGGPYQLRCFTQWNRNFEPAYNFLEVLPVFSSDPSEDWTNNDQSPLRSRAGSDSLKRIQIEITTLPSRIKKREKVTLNLELTDENGVKVGGDLSISVLDLNWLPADQVISNGIMARKLQLRQLSPPASFQMRYAAEDQLTFTGMVTDPQSGEMISTRMLALHRPMDHQFVGEQSENGHFSIRFPDFTGVQQWQVHNLNPFLTLSPKVQLRKPQALFAETGSQITNLPDSVTVHYRNLAEDYRAIQSLFVNQDNGKGGDIIRLDALKAFPDPDKQYDMRDYVNLDDVGEFIDEIILLASIREVDGQRTVRLNNPQTNKLFPYPPWYFLDGYMYTDEAQILNTPLSEIDRIETFLKRSTIAERVTKMLAGNGVICIWTKTGTLALRQREKLNLVDFAGYEPFPGFAQPDAPAPPYFPPLVFWKPDVIVHSRASTQVQFESTDAIGRFLVYAEGVTEGGAVVSGYTFYEVQF